jgi:hypothetical protein
MMKNFLIISGEKGWTTIRGWWGRLCGGRTDVQESTQWSWGQGREETHRRSNTHATLNVQFKSGKHWSSRKDEKCRLNCGWSEVDS